MTEYLVHVIERYVSGVSGKFDEVVTGPTGAETFRIEADSDENAWKLVEVNIGIPGSPSEIRSGMQRTSEIGRVVRYPRLFQISETDPENIREIDQIPSETTSQEP